MLFPTVEYALFFLAVLSIAWSVYRFPKVHKGFLLLASYAFYGFWNWTFLPLLIGISVFAGVVAKFIQHSNSRGARNAWLAVGVTVCLVVLGYFKYSTFVLANWFAFRGWFAPSPPRIPITSPLLPLGISFFVFAKAKTKKAVEDRRGRSISMGAVVPAPSTSSPFSVRPGARPLMDSRPEQRLMRGPIDD